MNTLINNWKMGSNKLQLNTLNISTKNEAVLKKYETNLIWTTIIAGNYNLQQIFDTSLVQNKIKYGTFDCLLKTSNGAHFKGNRFTATVNYYTKRTDFPHRYLNIINLDAGSYNGCSDGLTIYLNSNGDFSFSRGNCYQSISLFCIKLEIN